LNPLTNPQKRAIIREYLAGEKTASIAARWRVDPSYPRKLATMGFDDPPPPRRTVYVKPEANQKEKQL
jgi:hypothetical protein